eukprot:3691848-Amphidinium_carterae.1
MSMTHRVVHVADLDAGRTNQLQVCCAVMCTRSCTLQHLCWIPQVECVVALQGGRKQVGTDLEEHLHCCGHDGLGQVLQAG